MHAATYSHRGTPGMKGPKLLYAEGSVEEDTAASVRPQKLFSAKRILALFLGTPFTL
jgi:hypothetical protein